MTRDENRQWIIAEAAQKIEMGLTNWNYLEVDPLVIQKIACDVVRTCRNLEGDVHDNFDVDETDE